MDLPFFYLLTVLKMSRLEYLPLLISLVPEEIASLIDSYLTFGVTRLQRKFRYKRHKVKCDDCGAWRRNVKEVPSCTDYDCCFKEVCNLPVCAFKCPNKHLVYVTQSEDGYYDRYSCYCPFCRIPFTPSFRWYGGIRID